MKIDYLEKVVHNRLSRYHNRLSSSKTPQMDYGDLSWVTKCIGITQLLHASNLT